MIERETDIKQRRAHRESAIKTTGDKFLIDKNDFGKFLPVADPDSWGRLSILQNHKKIMHIMNQNYVKSLEMEKKFHNRNQKDLMRDDEYLQYKEDVMNTHKMATILRSLNEPKRKRVEEKKAEMAKTRSRRIPKNMHLMPISGYSVTKGSAFPNGSLPTVEGMTLPEEPSVE